MPRSMEKTQQDVLTAVADRATPRDAEAVAAAVGLGLRATRRHLTLLTEAKLLTREFRYTEPTKPGQSAVGRYFYAITAKGEAALTAGEAEVTP